MISSRPPTSRADLCTQLRARIDEIAQIISHERLGLAYHRPEPWSQSSRCFENVARKALQDGGRTIYGWTFHHRLVRDISGPGYLFVTHHAVWRAPSGQLIDVTPYPDPKHKPLAPRGDILFLVDSAAMPVMHEGLIAPLPLPFLTMGDDESLAAHVRRLNADEQQNWNEIWTVRQIRESKDRDY
jgi:hypothetical protein